MPLGGGSFLTQNKVLPGSYINFVSAANAAAQLSDRGYVAIPLILDWGDDTGVFAVEEADFMSNALKLFGYGYDDANMMIIRELFRNAKTVYAYRLNGGNKATVTTGNLTATAKWSGTRGNDLKVVIADSVDVPGSFDVSTYLGTTLIETQLALNAEDLADNDYIVFTGTGVLIATAGVDLASGTNKASVEGTDYQAFLDAIEAYTFNVVGCPSTDSTIIDLFVAFAKRLRDDNGIKCQAVVYRKETADHEGIISVQNTVNDAGANAASLVYWAAGVAAACQINKSNTNKVYDGEFDVDVDFTQTELSEAAQAGKFMFHKVSDTVRVLMDINTFTTFTAEKSKDFSSNQVIRTLDQIANDIAVLFNTKYLGNVQNNADGRMAFWSEIVAVNKELEALGAIEGFKADDVVVAAGNDKTSVEVTNPVTVVSAMEKLYMTVIVQ